MRSPREAAACGGLLSAASRRFLRHSVAGEGFWGLRAPNLFSALRAGADLFAL